MPTLLSDPPGVVYLLLFTAGVISGAVAFRRQDRRSVGVFLALVVTIAALGLIDLGFESPREEAVRRVQAMALAVHQKDPEAFLAQIAPTLEYNGGAPLRLTREQIRTSPWWNLLKQYDVEVAVWDFDREQYRPLSPTEVAIGFCGQGKVQGSPVPFYFRAVFARQEDGAYRLTQLSSYNFVQRERLEAIPNFP